MVEAARAEIETSVRRPLHERLIRKLFFDHLLPSPTLLKTAGALLYLYEESGLRRLLQASGVLRYFGKLGRLEHLAPRAEAPFFFDQVGRTFPAHGPQRHRVAFLAGCITNVAFARLNEATVRVLQQNGCEVVVPEGQGCCGALHIHAGLRDKARELARRNIDACLGGGVDAILTNTAGCGSTLKEYHELLEHDPECHEKAVLFVSKLRDINEWLASIGLRGDLHPLNLTVTYQDSCHLLHGQKIRAAPRELLKAIPGLTLRELPQSEICCGSAGIYNALQPEMAEALIARKIPLANATGAEVIATANPGCMIQLRAGVARYGKQQRVAHVVELLDESYRRRADSRG
jgi:glycolate oxidase iron-sulfur subunit